MRLIARILLLIVPVLCFAQEELNDDRKILKRRDVNAAMSEPVYRKLSAIHDHLGEDELSSALGGLKKLSNQRLSKYEKALVHQTYGFVYAQQGDETQAIRSFEQSIATNSMPALSHQGMLYSLAGLYVAEGQYLKSIDRIREWFRYEKSPNPEAYILIAASFTELQQFDNALPYVLKAIEKAADPHENWYMLAIAIHFQKQHFREAVNMLVTMLQYWPDKARYWEMLAGSYLELEEDKLALDTMMLSYTNGMLTKPTHVRAVAQLNLMHDIPYTAGVILEKEIAKGTIESSEENLKLLLQSWLSAREYDRAVDIINRLETYADGGEYFLQAAQIYNETGEWEKVVENTSKALDAGLKKPADALMLAGSAYSELDRFADATRAFSRAREIGDKNHRRNADSWIAFVKEISQLHNATISSN